MMMVLVFFSLLLSGWNAHHAVVSEGTRVSNIRVKDVELGGDLQRQDGDRDATVEGDPDGRHAVLRVL